MVWNPWQWEQSAGATPFAEATYVLKIWDDRGEQATIRAGYLSPYSGTQFSLYRPGKATPLSGESPFDPREPKRPVKEWRVDFHGCVRT